MATAHCSTALEALPDVLCGDRLSVPNGSKDRQHVGAGDVRDRPAADAREGVPSSLFRQARTCSGFFQPARFARPRRLCLGEGGHALGAALVGKRVAARARELAVGDGLLAGLSERDEGDAAESLFMAPAVDNEVLDPASGAGRLDVEVQAVGRRCGGPAGRCGRKRARGRCGDGDLGAVGARSYAGRWVRQELLHRRGEGCRTVDNGGRSSQ